MKTAKKWSKTFLLSAAGKVMTLVAIVCLGLAFISCNIVDGKTAYEEIVGNPTVSGDITFEETVENPAVSDDITSEEIVENPAVSDDIIFIAAQVNGGPGGANAKTSTGIELKFSENVLDLSAEDITIDGEVTPGELSGSGKIWTIALDEVKKEGEVTISVNKTGIKKTPKLVQVYTYDPAAALAKDSIAEKFDLRAVPVNAGDVTNVFTALHNYLQNHPDSIVDVIKLGDYVDLASLNVSGYPSNDTAHGKVAIKSNLELTSGKLLRLIVVGINTFRAKDSYTGNGNDSRPHIVFQFQNIAATRRINNGLNNSGGYAASEIRKYLTPVPGDEGSGKFLAGLAAAGVPKDVLWSPKRAVTKERNSADVNIIEDMVWLPTQLELFGTRVGSTPSAETAENQAHFAYYPTGTSGAEWKKYNATNADSWYWTASPDAGSSTGFCLVYGLSTQGSANQKAGGVAPAFCVQ
ncbi:MAG: DUF6273 domain-containing protein [Spirochaetaceae bacterium]|nr:DUF6273 domain-containing protein [Spirochaetaceae bacterium]